MTQKPLKELSLASLNWKIIGKEIKLLKTSDLNRNFCHRYWSIFINWNRPSFYIFFSFKKIQFYFAKNQRSSNKKTTADKDFLANLLYLQVKNTFIVN